MSNKPLTSLSLSSIPSTIEGFWATVKRAWYGQHHHYSQKYLQHYISEAVFKYNNRKNEPALTGSVNIYILKTLKSFYKQLFQNKEYYSL